MKSKIRHAAFTLLLTTSLIGIAGCTSSGAHRDRTAAQYKHDSDVAKNVQHALRTAPVYKYPDVNVSAYRGHVQLSGFVATDGQRRQAEAIARGVPGVTKVENNLLMKNFPGMGGTGEPENQ